MLEFKNIIVSPLCLMLVTCMFLASCNGQNQDNVSEEAVMESDPYTQQFNNIVGNWVSVNTSTEGFDTLDFHDSGNYSHKTDLTSDSGKWRIVDVQHMQIDDVNYRFFFKGRNLVLEDKKGNSYELSRRFVETPDAQHTQNTEGIISLFVRRIFQDKRGDLWFGTNGEGVCRYDGNYLQYYSINEGFGGVAVRGIVGDEVGNVWFGTSGGLTKYDGESFTNYTVDDGLINNDVWSMVIDSDGMLWIGTLQGVSLFDGEVFTPFDMPESEPDPTRGVTSARIVHCIMEDSKGRMWFATNGGAYIYDRESKTNGQEGLSNISEDDGLCSNDVNCIFEDKAGNIWFATHHNGVCRFDGASFTHITDEEGVSGTEVWDLYEDKSGDIWFPVEGYGVYRYDGNSESAEKSSFTNFHREEGLASDAIQSSFEDREGRIWFGGHQGLFRYDGESIYSVTKNGPWQ